MIELTEYFHEKSNIHHTDISLSGWLEAIIGNYYVTGEGACIENFHWLSIYYDASIDSLYESVEQNTSNLVAYVSSDYRWGFVLSKHIQKFQRDTAGYEIQYIQINDFGEEALQCSNMDLLPREFADIAWIDDDFMNDENLAFDYEKFSLIDDGILYLNPKHFSVSQLMMVMNDI